MWDRFLEGALSTVVYSGIGIALFAGGYCALALLLRRHNLSKQIDEHNEAAGIALAGFFIALALVVSGVIQ